MISVIACLVDGDESEAERKMLVDMTSDSSIVIGNSGAQTGIRWKLYAGSRGSSSLSASLEMRIISMDLT